MVANLNQATNSIKIISIPENTKILWDDAQKKIAKEISGYKIEESKINEMTILGGIDSIRFLTINELEELLGQKIDNYAGINLDILNKVVDSVGGLEINVPMDMRYNDPYQNLSINLKKGHQTLNGNEVEQFVRFGEGYINGELGRINQAQHIAIKELIKKVKETETTELVKLAPELCNDIHTDMSLKDIKRYLNLINKIQLENIEIDTIPGEEIYTTNRRFFIPKLEETRNILNTK